MSGPKKNGLPPSHQKAVESLLGDLKPVHAVWPAWAQWLLWLTVAVGVTLGALAYLAPHMPLLALLAEIPQSLFLILVYVSAGLAAWGAIFTSLPGRTWGGIPKTVTLLSLAAVVTVPFITFQHDPGNPGLVGLFHLCCNCVYVAVAVGVVPWLATGFLVSRNASFHPGWTGAWAGISAFLLGLGVAQIHCGVWEMGHVMMGHILPVALMTLAATWAGSFWFSKWRR